MDEQLLIAGCKRGDQNARKELYEQYAPAMLSVCMRYVNDRETARDLLQDGFIKVFTKFDTYAEIGSLGGWLRRVFVTTALEHLRHNDALKFSVSVDEYNDLNQKTNATAIDKLSADELMNCIAQLPNGYRTVFNLFALEGYSHKEIAEMLNIKESTSRSQFIRAREVLQKNVQSLLVNENVRQSKTS